MATHRPSEMSALEAAEYMMSELSSLSGPLEFAERIRKAYDHIQAVRGKEDADIHRTIAEEMIAHELDIRLTELEVGRVGFRIIH